MSYYSGFKALTKDAATCGAEHLEVLTRTLQPPNEEVRVDRRFEFVKSRSNERNLAMTYD